jgi:Glu-tRNA(Gln) amidotransferase subunit E-like FAD-binding protein
VMRKAVLDGSNTSGFQRTALVGLNGWLRTGFGRVGITNVALEEDACQIIKKDGKSVVYGLSRLGIPLVEIGTSPDIHTPGQAREAAERIGMILRSTGRVRRGIGTIRQDLNVSVKGGARCEIKGVQKLNLLPRIVELEARRQEELVRKGKRVSRDVRRALPDGRTEFLRPLPGAARMYPETDVPPIGITAKRLKDMRKGLPELLDEKLGKIKKRYGLNEEMASQLVSSGRAGLFEKAAKLSDPGLAALALTRYSREFRVPDERLLEFFRALGKERPPKEALEKMLAALSGGKTVKEALKLKGGSLSEAELEKIVRDVMGRNPLALKAGRPEQALMGLVMKEIRGRAPGSLVMKLILKILREK